MKYLLKQTWKATGIFREVAEFMNAVAAIINGTRVVSGGHMDMTQNGMLFHFDGASFPGTCYAPNGVATGGLTDGTKPWIEFNEQDWTFTEIVGPVATPWAAYRQYRLKADLTGPWYASVSG